MEDGKVNKRLIMIAHFLVKKYIRVKKDSLNPI
jgi:hypothetical protein